MYIKSMIVEGFKSYAQRTEINDFDPLFNAITGLNGSGKSNILDAICFLLGITNLTQVRAGNLQDLVYKCGQAGIAKATVCITFDNKDKKQSPLGYEQYDDITITRQVVIGGRNKYLINGSNANNSRVQDLFHSVQLNVNNPHFLIMQGRITKVLNMKPPEILSLIEEAAGTRLYESKKEVAKKTIEKKDLKLRAIEAVLNEDITPSLKKLKEERSSYLEYQKVLRELEHLNKLYIAYRYFSAEEKKKQSVEELDDMEKKKISINQTISELESRKAELEDKISDLEKKRDEVSGKVLDECENNLKEKQKELALCQSKLENKNESLKAEMKRKKQIDSNLLENEKSLTVRSSDLLDLDGALNLLKINQKRDQEKFEEAQNHLHAVTVGLSSNDDGADASLTNQLISAKKDITSSKAEKLSAQNKLKYFENELKEQQVLIKGEEESYKTDQKLYNAICQDVSKIETEMKKLCYDETKDESLTAEQKSLLKDIEDLGGKLDLMSSRYPHLTFEYTDPEKNFDHSRVKGLVCKLVQVKDKRTATSLEVAAGGKLYNVVVDTEVTAKKIVDNGQLKKRYTIIPLNKISSRPIDSEIVKRAESLVGKENVSTALSLVGYDTELHTAMQYVFGSCFICPDMEVSKQITYNEKIMKITVTLDGDSFDPSGTLTGGARKQKTGVLQKLQEFKKLEEELKLKQSKVEQINKEIANVKVIGERYLALKMEYDLKMQEANKMKAKLEQTKHHEQLTVINNLSASIEEQKTILKTAEEKQIKFEEKVKDLEKKLKNAKTVRENELKLAEKSLNQAKVRKEESEKELKSKLQEIDSIKLEEAELKKEIDGYKKQQETTVAVIEETNSAIVELKQKQEEMKVAVDKLQQDVSEQKKMLKSKNREILENVNQLNLTQKEICAAQIEIQDIEHKISKHQKDSREAHRLVENLSQEHEWIAEERKFFGKQNTSYDFKIHDPKEAERLISTLTVKRDELSKNVNMRAMNMLGKAEEQYNDLIKKRQIVLNDKAKIASVIVELDEKKNDALKKAWTQVNKDFKSIFSSLLPGTQAKLTPPDGKTVLDGLEIKVAFGDVWKESLSELSGGQRSLVALSLILSLLLFKPAPIYILDEVDAALDLSHTQNIGQMIKSHFQHSQFIVVSLKDGMFSNANVLFKTKFVDGVSTVTRHAQHPSKAIENDKSTTKQLNKK